MTEPLSGTRDRAASGQRPSVHGKFIVVAEEKLFIRGVTYGPFGPKGRRSEFGRESVERDFAAMAANGVNAVRVYTVPPRWLLDVAAREGLFVMVGLPWEQHIAFLEERERARTIEQRVRAGVRACAGHPAVLCYAIGNEIPASIVRWHGRRGIERYLERLYRAAKDEEPEALVTYVNYPSTEYLQLPLLDFACFNVYLEHQQRLEAYLNRLQNIAGPRPLVIAEIGLDSRRNGEEGQARALGEQVRTSFTAGCAGAFVFAWTDEWHRGGYEVEDWDFGLTSRDRRPKPALAAVREAFAEVPFPADRRWPRISVVVCSRNGAARLRDCLEGLARLEYPDHEVILVSDGSTDATTTIAREYDVRLIETNHGGLGRARNLGLAAATGEIIAYLDDDARPDPHWLTYLAHSLLSSDSVGVGGPNLACPEDGRVAWCVANAPGGPTHVLLSDRQAEHLPGCNMAFRRAYLDAVGGFDPQFHIAGDDVDLCWRLRERGWSLGFSPAAFVWHHRRDSIRAYLRQQRGYGNAEALLERKWPEKYSPSGHLSWRGRLYGNGSAQHRGRGRWRIYYGTWGNGLFQSLYRPADGLLESLPMMPEWYLALVALAVLSAAGAFWPPLLLTLPLLALAVAALLFDAFLGAMRASFPVGAGGWLEGLGLRSLTAGLYLLQPLARLYGRFRFGLTPWRRRGCSGRSLPRPRTSTIWSERWEGPEQRLRAVEAAVRADGAVARRGGAYDRWDLEVRGGMLGGARLRMAIEEHGAGKQLVRFRWWPRLSRAGPLLAILPGALALAGALTRAWAATGFFGLLATGLLLRALYECGAAAATIERALERRRLARRTLRRALVAKAALLRALDGPD